AAALAALGFLIAGAAAFAHGSLIVTGDPHKVLGIARIVSGAALIPMAVAWGGGFRLRLLLIAAILCWIAAGITEIVYTAGPGLAVDSLLVAGSLLLGATILRVSRNSVAAKVAASGATTLLLVVVVLAVALSAVISSSLQRDDLKQLSSSARTETSQMAAAAASTAKDARFAATILADSARNQPTDPLIQIGSDAPGAPPPAAAASQIQTALKTLVSLYPSGFAYSDPYSTVVAAAGSVDSPSASRLARDLNIAQLPCLTGDTTPGIFVEGNTAWAAAAFPVCLTNGRLLGAVIDAVPFNSTYLATRAQADPVPTLALVSVGSVIAVNGPQPSAGALAAAETPGGTRVVDNDLVSTVPISVASASPPLSVLLMAPATNELSTRTQLYRTLFLIALGGTVLALGLAVFVGDRITSGVRRLTQVASRIGRGDVALRSEVRGDDEVATLASVFNAMLDSVQDQANALQSAADQETRLRNRMEAVIAGMTDGLVAVDSSGRVTDINRAAEELTGVSARAASGRPVDKVVSAAAEDGSSLGPRLLDPGPAPWTRIASIESPDNGPVPVAVSSGAVRGPGGEMIGNVFLLHDLRREREVERMKDEFLSRIGHELRTPLTPIKAYADLLLRKQSVPPEQAGTWYSEIRRSSDQLQRIVEMLEFSASSGAGRMLMRFEEVDVRGLVRSLAASWSEKVPPNVTIGRKVARDLPTVVADKRWLAKALDELIGNAVKFSPDGGRIVVGASKVSSTGSNGAARGNRKDYVEISVTDHGVGMARDQAERMFGDFVQGDASDTRAFGGLGLGLTLAQRVVEGHGGSISCRSEIGRGSTFFLRIPVPDEALDITQPDGLTALG
ncbi:MAG TPA: ATP-binding protein, partial [Acidimicrobiales bacterium]|nr:ATP-binding protein [Acidimicrobiales bacterium]